jgi:hypothetical protein
MKTTEEIANCYNKHLITHKNKKWFSEDEIREAIKNSDDSLEVFEKRLFKRDIYNE